MRNSEGLKAMFGRSRHIAGLMTGVATCALIAGAAQAQPAPATGAVEEIVVTGSRISGVAPVGSSVVSVGRADVEASGAVTTTQLIQQVPQVFNLGVSENSRGQSGGSGNITYGSTINLRGIGPFTTLVMLNGHRAVPQGTTGFAVDPSIIPTIGLERVEIVADGASAIYGSDAVAGVVNLILRRNFEGVEANARYGAGDNYNERQFGVIAGHRWDKGQFTVSFENGFHSALKGASRDFYSANLTGRGGGDFRPVQCNPGTITLSGVSYPIPAGGVTTANRNALVAGAANKCDNLKIADLFPRQNHNAGSFTFDQEITDRFSVYADGFAAERTFRNRNGGATSTVTVPSSNAFFVAPPGLTPATESVGYSFINDYPQGYTDGFSKSYEATLGARFKLTPKWKFEADYTYGRDTDRSVSHNVANAAALKAALASSNPATAFNVFGGPNSAAVVNNILIGRSEAPGRSSLQFYEAKVDGSLFALPGGEVRVAAGYEGQSLHVVQNNIAGTITAPTQLVRVFDRKVNSVYGELLIPLVSDLNAMAGIRKLDIDIAGRYDHYSDVGGTSNPKIGVNWSPVDSLTLRGSYGTSFRAPTISQIYGNSNNLFVQNYSDPTTNTIRQGVARSGANLNIKPETAKTWSLGADYKPDFLPRAKFSLTYFHIDYDNQVVAYLSDLTVLNREAQFNGTGIIVRNPTPAFIAQQVAETGFTGVLPSPVTLFVEGRNSNLGKTLAQGLDFQFNYRVPTEHAGTFDFGVNGTYFTEYKVAITQAAPLISQLNNIFNPLRFKARGSAAWTDGAVQASLFLNYLNGYNNNLATPIQRVDAYTTADLHLAYRFNTKGVLHAFTVALDVTNLFDARPPFVNIAESANGGGGFDPTLVNPVGRVIAISLDKKF
jgi:iron complex outermembrane receptor protein